jgi:hypothetical protein
MNIIYKALRQTIFLCRKKGLCEGFNCDTNRSVQDEVKETFLKRVFEILYAPTLIKLDKTS